MAGLAMPTPAQKAASTRKRRQAAAKAALTRKRRTAARKAAATRKRRTAARKAAATRERGTPPRKGAAMSTVSALHGAVKRGDLNRVRVLLSEDSRLANSLSETDPRGTYPLHVAAEFGQVAAAQLLLQHGADVSLSDKENDAIALGWAAFFGRPEVVALLLDAGSAPSQRNKHGLTPLGCAVGGFEGRWQKFSDATLLDWQRAAQIIRARGGEE